MTLLPDPWLAYDLTLNFDPVLYPVVNHCLPVQIPGIGAVEIEAEP